VQDALRAGWARRDAADRARDGLVVADLPESVAWLLHPDKRVIGFFASQEAVDLYRELAAVSRDAYLPDLATSLWMVGVVYLEVDGPHR
jgi:hypothetical protein